MQIEYVASPIGFGLGGGTESAKNPTWSQNHLAGCDECVDHLSTAQEWGYLANGRISPIPESEAEYTQQPPDCFCDHSAIAADFGDLEHIDLTKWRAEMDAIADGFGEEFRKVFLGLANNLGYHWATCTGALSRGEHGRLVVDKEIARKVINAPFLMQCALTSIRDYVDEHWDLNITRQTLTRWLKDKLEGLGVVQWWGRVAQGKRPRQWVVNMPAMLLLAEACERRILGDARMEGASHGEEMDVLPEHRGYSLALLFESVFPGFGWNREGGAEDTPPIGYTATDEYQASRPERPVQQPVEFSPPSLPEIVQRGLDAIENLVRLGLPELAIDETFGLLDRWPAWERQIASRAARMIEQVMRGATP